jgi:hypothetical protein
MTQLRQSVEEYIARMNDQLDELFIAIETRDASKQHLALAGLIGLLEMLKSEVENADDEDEEDPP